MQRTDSHTDRILDQHISGFHTYILSDPPRLSFASRSFCEMLGVGRAELMGGDGDGYTARVHPADRALYADYLREPTGGGQTLGARYRIVRGDGRILHVSDTMTTELRADGTLLGHSVLADVTELQEQVENLRFLSDTIPCGFLKYTCEKAPRITYINDQMLRFLRFPEDEGPAFDSLEMYKENIYTMVPVEERRRFSLYLDLVRRRGVPIAGEMPILRCDGSTGHLFGWVTKSVDEQGREEFQSVCMDMTEQRQIRKRRETDLYLSALADAYDLIFEFDFGKRTVTCLHARGPLGNRWAANVPMDMGEAADRLVLDAASQEGREAVRAFFARYRRGRKDARGNPPTVHYEVALPDGGRQPYSGLFLKTDPHVSLYCCKADVDGRVRDAAPGHAGQAGGEGGAGEGPAVRIRAFGFFDVFVDGRPIAFRNKKSKELFALLVDRKGGFVSSDEAIGFLWEDEPVSSVTLARYRKVALRLKNTLSEYGISDVVESVNGERRLVTDRVSCDLYDYLSGAEEFSQLFKGSYLSNYSWGETTLAELTGERLY